MWNKSLVKLIGVWPHNREGRTHIIVGRVHKQIHACEDTPLWCRSEQTP
jgi:hypothetical protein